MDWLAEGQATQKMRSEDSTKWSVTNGSDETTGVSVNPGDHLDHYRIDRVVAHSNEATIFHATDLRNGGEVAIKVPHPEMDGDPAFADRFNRELEIRNGWITQALSK